MGNRAILKFQDERNQPSIYLHWNGGRASVQAFLNVARKFNLRESDYGIARLCQIIGNFFGGNLSLGVSNNLHSQGDNGVYLIKNFEIIGREDFDGEEEIDEEKTQIITDYILDLHKKIDVLREEISKEEKYKS
jgi:hypothetical protein